MKRTVNLKMLNPKTGKHTKATFTMACSPELFGADADLDQAGVPDGFARVVLGLVIVEMLKGGASPRVLMRVLRKLVRMAAPMFDKIKARQRAKLELRNSRRRWSQAGGSEGEYRSRRGTWYRIKRLRRGLAAVPTAIPNRRPRALPKRRAP